LGSVLVATVIYPDYWSSFKVAYEHSNTFKPIFKIDFELELDTDFSIVKKITSEVAIRYLIFYNYQNETSISI